MKESNIKARPKTRGKYKTRKKDRNYIDISPMLYIQFKKSVEGSGLNINKITKKYFNCSPATMYNIFFGKSKRTNQKTLDQMQIFINKFYPDREEAAPVDKEASEPSKSDEGIGTVTSVVYQTVNTVEILEKLIAVRNISKSDVDSSVKVDVISDIVKSV